MELMTALMLIIFSAAATAQTVLCENHPTWLDDRKFSAEIELSKSENNKVDATITKLILSESWPLASECESPLSPSNKRLTGAVRGDKITLWLPKGNECGFMFFMVTDSDTPTLLSPKKTTDHFVEEPFLASCRAVRP